VVPAGQAGSFREGASCRQRIRRASEQFEGESQMVDAELLRHQEAWKGFTRLIKWSIGGIVVLLVLMAAFLLPHGG
jgi:stress response protein SCP2